MGSKKNARDRFDYFVDIIGIYLRGESGVGRQDGNICLMFPEKLAISLVPFK